MPTKPLEKQPQHEGKARYRAKSPWGTKQKVLLGAGIVVALVILGGIWVGALALSTKSSLEHAQATIAQIQEKAAAQDFEGALALVDDVKSDTATAASNTNQPVWRLFEFTPVLGSNLTVVRQISTVIDDLVVKGVDPVVAVAGDGIDSFKPVDGRIDVQKIRDLSAAVALADDQVAASVTSVEDIDADGTLGPVADAATMIKTLLTEAAEPVHQARKVTDALPAILGGDAPRNYILLFPNNAESVSLGGNTAAWVLLNVTDGAIAITGQPSSQDFPRDEGVPIALPAEPLQFYGADLFSYATNVELRPDFPTAGALAQGFWQRESGQVVDGVLSFDPIALSYLLSATGPLTLPTGEVLQADNAVKMLLSDVYANYTVPAQQDAFFAGAAAAVFSAVTTSTPDIPLLVNALSRSVDEHRLMAWSALPAEQELLAGTTLGGTLATDNVDKTEIGVFFVENSASKMSYYLNTAVALTNNSCLTPETPNFTASISLNSAISAAEYSALPAYVKSQVYLRPVKTRTLVYVYGPVGGAYIDTTWNQSGMLSEVVSVGTDLGRPVVGIAVDLRPGETSNVSVTFAGAPGEYGPAEARVTPMINATTVGSANPGCE